MINKERINSMPDYDFVCIALTCESKVELHKVLKIPYSGTGVKLLNDKFKKTNAKLKTKVSRWKQVEKLCPVCDEKFVTKEGHRDEKTVCSHGCANTFFRTGENSGAWRESSYRSTCFLHHEKQCLICGEKLIVSVHHFDGDKNNNSPENLLPLCPTHHQYIHSRYSYIVENKIIEYRNNFILAMKK